MARKIDKSYQVKAGSPNTIIGNNPVDGTLEDVTYNQLSSNVVSTDGSNALSIGGDGKLFVSSTGSAANPAAPSTSIQFNDNGVFGGDVGITWNKTTNSATISKDNGVVSNTQGLLTFSQTNGTGTSDYDFYQNDYDIFVIERSGDTTGDGAVWSLVAIDSPTKSTTLDSEATLSLTTRAGGGAGSNEVRTLDVYNDEYSRDNGMGLRQLTKNTQFNPIRFEQHNKDISNGQWRFDDCYTTADPFIIDCFSQATITGGVLAPQIDDWIWDNGSAFIADDTKIIEITPIAGGYRFTLNRAVIGTASGASFRGKPIHEYMRFTPDRRLLVRKFIEENTSTIAEFGGDVAIDGVFYLKGLSSPPANPLPGNGGIYFDGVNYHKWNGTSWIIF